MRLYRAQSANRRPSVDAFPSVPSARSPRVARTDRGADAADARVQGKFNQMSIAYRIKEPNLVLEVWVGTIRKEELFEHERRLMSDPQLPSAPRVIVDMTGASLDPALTRADIREFVDFYQHYRDKKTGTKIAIVAGKDFDKASLYSQLVAQWQVKAIVFTTFTPACTWLGVNETEVREWMEQIHAELLDDSTSDP